MRLLSRAAFASVSNIFQPSRRALTSIASTTHYHECSDGLKLAYERHDLNNSKECILMHGWLDNSATFTPFLNLAYTDVRNQVCCRDWSAGTGT